MRKILLLSVCLSVMSTTAQAQQESPWVANTLFSACEISDNFCIGFLAGHAAWLKVVHENVFKVRFGKITKPFDDDAKAMSLLSTIILVGPNICFPPAISLDVFRRIFIQYAQKHPADLAGSAHQMVNFAFTEAYGCGPKSPYND